MSTDPHPGFRAAADLLYLLNEGVHAVMIGSGEAVSRALAPTHSRPPALHVVTRTTSEQQHRLSKRRSTSL